MRQFLKRGLLWMRFVHGCDRFTRIATEASHRVERNLGKQRYIHLFRCTRAAALAEYVDSLTAMRAIEKTHILDDTQHFLAHLLEHVDCFARVFQ